MDVAQRLLAAAARVRLLGAVAPREADAERARLVREVEAGRDPVPRWTYVREDAADPLARELERIADGCEADAHGDRESPGGRLLLLYCARARELGTEARLVARVGTAGFGDHARRRFGLSAADATAAEARARSWAAPPAADPDGPLRTTDGPEPESLASRMRQAIGQARVPFAVEVRGDLLALAATGERTVFVAAGRTLTDEDVRRTVAHELHAHVLPRARAARQEARIFQLGTARGADDQEGYALVLEERMQLLSARRKRELAVRHLSTVAMDRGASFVECFRALRDEHALAPQAAILVAERVYRGGDGVHAGLGRERVYLASFASVGAHLAEQPDDEPYLTHGQIAIDAIASLRAAGVVPS